MARGPLCRSNRCVVGLGHGDVNDGRFPKTLTTLDEWTDKRHRIVHRGELVKMRRDFY